MSQVLPSIVAFDRLVADIAVRFVDVRTEDLDALITDSQQKIVESLEFDRCALWQFTANDEDLIYTHGWTRPELPLTPPGVSARRDYPWFFERVKANETVWNESVADVPSPEDRETMRLHGTVANAVVPVHADGRVVGALSFGSMTATRTWNRDVVDRLRLLAAVFGQGLMRRDHVRRLEAALAEVERLKDRLAIENNQLRDEMRSLRTPATIAAGSRSVRAALELAGSVAPTDASVLLHGETGTGKELFAQEIHRLSPRAGRDMVRVNCAAIPTALLESELFGRERGAYTGALSRQAGRFELAHGTTIFLDEIGELPLDAQAKLLRVLQERTIERLGGTKAIPVDVRVIAATNRDLAAEVRERAFREDLYYRLNVFPITVPPLRERVEDIPDLVWTFVDEFCRAFHKRIQSISRDSLEALQRYAWPGNVRELRNLIERAVILSSGPRLVVEPPAPARSESPPVGTSLVEVEANHILGVLEQVGWRVRGSGGAAEILRMNPTTLDSRMVRLGIRRPARRRSESTNS